MSRFSSNRRVTVPESLLMDMENLRSEVQVLRRTVDSKSAAVAILRQQLIVATDISHSSANLQDQSTQTKVKEFPMKCSSPDSTAVSSSGVLVELLSASKRENKSLKQDLMDLSCKLHDAQADLKVVRSEAPRASIGSGPLQQQWHRQERLHLIHQMELLTEKVGILEADVRCLSEEREELLREREYTSLRLTGLKTQLRAATIARRDSTQNSPRRDSTQNTPRRDSTQNSPRRDSTQNTPRRDSTQNSPRRESIQKNTSRESTSNTTYSRDGTDNSMWRQMNTSSDYNISDSMHTVGDAKDGSDSEYIISGKDYKQGQMLENSDGDDSTIKSLLHQNRNLTDTLRETEGELGRMKAVVADYELLTSLQQAARQGVYSQHQEQLKEPPDAGGVDMQDGHVSSSNLNHARRIEKAGANYLVAEKPSAPSGVVHIAPASINGCEAGSSPSHDVFDDEVPESPSSVGYDVEHEDPLHRTYRNGKQIKGKDCGQDNGRVKTGSSNPPIASVLVKEAGLPIEANDMRCVALSDSIEANCLPVKNGGQNAGGGSSTCQTITMCNPEKWMVEDDATSGYIPRYSTITSSSNCIEEIVPLDQIDHYMEELRLSQLKQTAIKKERATKESICTVESEMANEIDSTTDAKISINNKAVASTISDINKVTECSTPDQSEIKPIAVVNSGKVTQGTSSNPPCADISNDDPFSDYNSDDDTFEAELHQWQKSTVDLISQTNRK